MIKTLAITAIVSVAVIMVFGLVTPVLFLQAEAHVQGKIRGHFDAITNPDRFHDGDITFHDSCTRGNMVGALHYVDINGNKAHDEQAEPTICLPGQA